MVDEDGDDEGEDGLGPQVLPGEDKWVRKMVNPKVPSKEEVERHWLMGQMLFRNWCPVCRSPGQGLRP